MSVETLGRLAALPNIAGVKDATGDLARVTRDRLACGEDFVLLSGEDITALAYNAHGGKGCISVASNVAPRQCAAFQTATLAGDYDAARLWQDKLAPLHDALFADTSPGPTKYALSLLGKCAPDVRLPVVEPDDAAKAQVREAMRGLDLID